MASRSRVEHESLVPYAITTARNLIASLVQREQRARRHAHLFAEVDEPEPRPEDELLRQEEVSLVGTAMARLTAAEQDILLAHEVAGHGHGDARGEPGSTPGAVAAQLNRTRCPAAGGVSAGAERAASRRPTAAVRCCWRSPPATDAGSARSTPLGHLLELRPLRRTESAAARARPAARDDEVRVAVAPMPTWSSYARRPGSWPPRPGFSRTDLTVIATAVSEVARNIVRVRRARHFVVAAVRRGPTAGRARRGSRHRSRHPGRGAGAAGRLQHVRRPRTRLARRPTADGRLRCGDRGRHAAPR